MSTQHRAHGHLDPHIPTVTRPPDVVHYEPEGVRFVRGVVHLVPVAVVLWLVILFASVILGH